MEMSSHLHVEAASHLLCAAPTAHWLEHMDVAAGLRRADYPLADGLLTAPERPGIGLEWDEEKVARHRVP
jgi:mandelate racemase